MEVRDRSGELSVLALQGPASPAILARLAPATPPGLRYFRFARADIDGRAAWIGRIGYTGERGYELLVQRETAVALWGRLLSLGARACGFEAADYELLTRPGPRLGEAAGRLADCLAGLAKAPQR